jgi:hypothetical protein
MVLRQNYSSRQPDNNYAMTPGKDNSSDMIHHATFAHEPPAGRLTSSGQDLLVGICWQPRRIAGLPSIS